MNSYTNKKGVSPLIATVLLIVFAIAIASILLSWLGGYTSDTTEKAKASSDATVACSKQAVSILRVFANSTKFINRVDVQSKGMDAVIVKNVLVSTTGTTAPCDFTNNTQFTQVPGNITTYSNGAAPNCAVTCNNIDTVRVVTACGGVTAIFTGNSSVVGCP